MVDNQALSFPCLLQREPGDEASALVSYLKVIYIQIYRAIIFQEFESLPYGQPTPPFIGTIGA